MQKGGGLNNKTNVL